MSLLTFIPGAIVAIGAIFLLLPLAPSRPQLSDALGRLGNSNFVTVDASQQPRPERVGTWVQSRLPDLPFLTTPTDDLDLVEMPSWRFYWEKTLLALTGFLAPALFGLIMQLIGALPMGIPALIGIPLGIGMWFIPDHELRLKARNARREYARAVAVYLELVATERLSGSSAADALTNAARISTSPVFRRIRQELTRAQIAGTPPWSALSTLSDQIRVPELGEIAKIMRLSGDSGASVAETLRARGKTLRVQLLADEHTRANEASERLSIPLTLLAFVFVGIILTPLILNLFK